MGARTFVRVRSTMLRLKSPVSDMNVLVKRRLAAANRHTSRAGRPHRGLGRIKHRYLNTLTKNIANKDIK